MICERCNEVVVRKQDGSRTVVVRCVDSQSPYFTQNMDEEKCKQCPRHQAAVALAAVPTTPNLIKRAATWTAAVVDWKLQGSPERSDEEVEHIYTTFCNSMPPCAWFDQDKQVCRGCGCGVTRDGAAIFNKIRMATQHCPRTLW